MPVDATWSDSLISTVRARTLPATESNDIPRRVCVFVCLGGEGWLMRQACKWRQYANDAQAPDSLFGDEKEGNLSEV